MNANRLFSSTALQWIRGKPWLRTALQGLRSLGGMLEHGRGIAQSRAEVVHLAASRGNEYNVAIKCSDWARNVQRSTHTKGIPTRNTRACGLEHLGAARVEVHLIILIYSMHEHWRERIDERPGAGK